MKYSRHQQYSIPLSILIWLGRTAIKIKKVIIKAAEVQLSKKCSIATWLFLTIEFCIEISQSSSRTNYTRRLFKPVSLRRLGDMSACIAYRNMSVIQQQVLIVSEFDISTVVFFKVAAFWWCHGPLFVKLSKQCLGCLRCILRLNWTNMAVCTFTGPGPDDTTLPSTCFHV